MKIFMTAVIMAMLSFASAGVAQAQDVDMGKITCKQFLDAEKGEMESMLFWLDGYISALSENTVMSEEWMIELGTHLASFCIKNNSATLLEAVDAME